MMIVDLVDEQDFNEKLAALGIPVGPGIDLEATTGIVEAWLDDHSHRRLALLALYESLLDEQITLLPEVRHILKHHIDRFLRP